MAVSQENKNLAKYFRSVIGGKPSVTRYWDDAHKSFVDMFCSRDVPARGISSHATLGLSDASIGRRVGRVPLRVELLMAARTAYDFAPNILATCAFNVINSKMECEPGSMFPRVVELYGPALDMRHVVLVTPFLWELETQKFAKKIVTTLQVVPISDAEYAFAGKKGAEALEELFEKKEIDVFNLDRKSVV